MQDEKPTQTVLYKDGNEVKELAVELTPLLACVQDVLEYWEDIDVMDPGLQKAIDFSMSSLEKRYTFEVNKLANELLKK